MLWTLKAAERLIAHSCAIRRSASCGEDHRCARAEEKRGEVCECAEEDRVRNGEETLERGQTLGCHRSWRAQSGGGWIAASKPAESCRKLRQPMTARHRQRRFCTRRTREGGSKPRWTTEPTASGLSSYPQPTPDERVICSTALRHRRADRFLGLRGTTCLQLRVCATAPTPPPGGHRYKHVFSLLLLWE